MVDRISTLLHNTKGLVTNYGEGGLQNGEVLPLRKRGSGKSFRRGSTQSFGVVFAR